MAKNVYEVCGLKVTCNEREQKVNELMKKIGENKIYYLNMYEFYLENGNEENIDWAYRNAVKHKVFNYSNYKKTDKKEVFTFLLNKLVKECEVEGKYTLDLLRYYKLLYKINPDSTLSKKIVDLSKDLLEKTDSKEVRLGHFETIYEHQPDETILEDIINVCNDLLSESKTDEERLEYLNKINHYKPEDETIVEEIINVYKNLVSKSTTDEERLEYLNKINKYKPTAEVKQHISDVKKSIAINRKTIKDFDNVKENAELIPIIEDDASINNKKNIA